jgi:putative MATE family efflux protein
VDDRWNNRALFSLLWPLIIEQILALTMGAVDTLMVATVGEYAVSAVNIVDNINNLMIIAFTALSTGGAVVVSQYIGRKDYKNSSLAARQLVYIVTIISLLIAVIAVLFRRPLIGFIYGKIEDNVMNSAAIYFLLTGLSYPFLALNNANSALFRAAGNSKTPMQIAFYINIIHIVGNIFFIYSLKLGVAGAALSTLICRLIAAVITTVMLTQSKYGPISLSGLFNIYLVRPMIKNILNVGIPGGLESSMFQIGRLLTQRIFTVFGTTAMAANAITSVINSLSFMPGTAYGIALLTIVGQCVGAKDYAAAKKQTLKIMKISYITLFVIGAIIFVCMEPMIRLFNLSPEAQALSKSFLQVHCISIALGWAMSFILPNALRAAGDVRFVMIAATISMWIVRVSAAYLFTFTLGLGPLGVWLAMGADFIVRGICYFWRWNTGKWQEKQVIKY